MARRVGKTQTFQKTVTSNSCNVTREQNYTRVVVSQTSGSTSVPPASSSLILFRESGSQCLVNVSLKEKASKVASCA